LTHLGVYSELKDGILWLSSTDYVAFKALLVLAGDRTYDDAKRNRLNSALSYYAKADLERILTDIDELGWMWSDAIRYLQEKAPATRTAIYRELCDKPRIAQELEKFRTNTRRSRPTGTNDQADE
jgi:hypothetical protein